MNTNNYTAEYTTEVGLIELTYVFNDDNSLNYLVIKLDGQEISYPKSWSKQTSRTIIRKVCELVRNK